MNCTRILLLVSIVAAVTCFASGQIGPALVTVASLAAVYMYRYKDQFTFLAGWSRSAVASVKAQAEETGTKGVSKAAARREARNHRPGLPPPRDGTMLQVLPNAYVPSEGPLDIRRRQVGILG